MENRGIWGKSDRKSTPWTHINVLLRLDSIIKNAVMAAVPWKWHLVKPAIINFHMYPLMDSHIIFIYSIFMSKRIT